MACLQMRLGNEGGPKITTRREGGKTADPQEAQPGAKCCTLIADKGTL
jgi:hypothetical protein